MKPKNVSLSREALYDLVWSEKMKDVAERFNMSDVAMRKICRKYAIPMPSRGYWKLEASNYLDFQERRGDRHWVLQ